jgi:hypothetical protein
MQTTDAAGTFNFTTADCTLTVERELGNPFASVSGDDWFGGYVLHSLERQQRPGITEVGA